MGKSDYFSEGVRSVSVAAILLFFLISCAKKSQKTEVRFSFGVKSHVVGPLYGGIVIWGVESAKGKAFAITLAGQETQRTLHVENGNWNFYSVGWAGPSLLEGLPKCGTASQSLTGYSTAVPITLSDGGCEEPFFSTPSFKTSPNQFFPLRFITCTDLAGINGPGASCNGSLKGNGVSYQVVIPPFVAGAFQPPPPPEYGPLLVSSCVTRVNTVSSVTPTNLRVPVGQSIYSPTLIQIRSFDTANCLGGVAHYAFFNGLLNGSGVAGRAKIFPQTSSGPATADLYLRTDPPGGGQAGPLSISEGSPYDFGSVPVGSTGSKLFTLTNNIQETVILNSATVSPSVFSFPGGSFPGVGSCTSSLLAGNSCTFTVRFLPTATSFYSGSVNINFTDILASHTVTKTLAGTGGTGGTTLAFSGTNPTSFGTITTNTFQDTVVNLFLTSAGLPVTGISGNILASPFTFTGGGFPGTGGTCGSSLAYPNTCNISVRFFPASSGNFNSTMTVTYFNGVSTNSVTRGLSGTGSGLPIVTSISPPSGSFAGGDTITISGDRFLGFGTPSVTAGGIPCSPVTVASTTSLSCLSGGGAIPGTNLNVGVTTSGGTSTATAVWAYLETEFGNGADGDVNISSHGNIDVEANTSLLGGRFFSTSRKVNAINTSNGQDLTLNGTVTSNQYRVKDEVMWLVSAARNNSDCHSGGNLPPGAYGFGRIQAISGSVISIFPPVTASPGSIQNSNMTITATASNFCMIQVVRVPNIKNLTVDPAISAVLSSTGFSFQKGAGGVLALRVSKNFQIQTTTIFALDASARGFPKDPLFNQGGGYRGIGATSPGPNANGGGGGLTPDGGGGGGGHSGTGGAGGFSLSGNEGLGGQIVSCSLSSTQYAGPCLFMGGAGGGAQGGAPGGHGGGIIYLTARNFTESGSLFHLLARGEPGANVGGGTTGGGGAGGNIFFMARDLLASGNVQMKAHGGPGGTSVTDAGGGGGGGGEIRAIRCTPSSPLPSFDVSGGLPGSAGATFPVTGNPGVSASTASGAYPFCNL